ncbi:hypothetical protein RB598_007752 [Gaeumannomyces tritici]
MTTGPLLAGLGAGCSLASYTGNINYFSPSAHHPGLGVSIRKVAARHYANSPWDPAALNFSHGVASGDPYQDSVILWTRAAPAGSDNDGSNVTVSGLVALYSHETEKYVKASAAPVCLQWSVSESRDLGSPADSGTAYTSSDIDYTVKVEARNLKPFTTYWYQFGICDSDVKSPLGRTKTLPARGSKDVSSIKLAVYSCSNYPFGFFNAYGNVVNKDSVDYVVHLGDYIYEYANGQYGWGDSLGRIPLPDKEIVSLYDYRKRHATYRTDAGLHRSHQSFPWIPTWDDHEVADNVWKAGSAGMNNSEDSFVREGGVSTDQRKMNAVRAYFEWMPIRQVDMDDNLRVWRSFAFGDLLDLVMLDTRVYDRSVTDLYWNTPYVDAIRGEASRSLMGPRQESWFYRTLRDSKRRGAAWRVVGSQVVFSHIDLPGGGGGVNADAWDGYAANRGRTLQALAEGEIGNNIFLAGDTHVSWVADVAWPAGEGGALAARRPYDPATGDGALGVEFAGTAVSSPSSAVGQNGTLDAANAAAEALQSSNGVLQWQESYYRGYFELEVGFDEVRASFFGTPVIATANGLEIPLANFTVRSGENRLQRDAGNNRTVVRGGVVEAGSLKGGSTVATNLTHDTATGEWAALQW